MLCILLFWSNYLFEGPSNGTCGRLEREMGRTLLHLACRHHVLEIVLRCVAETCWPCTTGPNVPIFKRFQQEWDTIDKTMYQTGMQDKVIADTLDPKQDEIHAVILHNFEVNYFKPINDVKSRYRVLHKFLLIF